LHLHELEAKGVEAAEVVVCLWYTVGGKLSVKKLEERINMMFCVKIGKSASEMLALLTLACGKYAMKKLSVSKWHAQGRTRCAR
jgi:hypothetical protein